METARCRPLSHDIQALLPGWADLGIHRKWNTNNPHGPDFERMEFFAPEDKSAKQQVDTFIATLYRDSLIPEEMRKHFEAKNPWFTLYRLTEKFGEIDVDEALVFPISQKGGGVSVGIKGEKWVVGKYIEIEQKQDERVQLKAEGDIMLLIVGYEPA